MQQYTALTLDIKKTNWICLHEDRDSISIISKAPTREELICFEADKPLAKLVYTFISLQ